MKKVKFSMGEGGFQGFMLQHVEKCVLAVIVLAVGWLIWNGSTAPAPLDQRITKEELKKSALRADEHIARSEWEKIVTKRQPASNPEEEVTKRIFDLDSSKYPIRNPDPPIVVDLNPRKDPVLLAAENVRVTPLFGPLVLKSEEGPASATAVRRPDAERPKEAIDRLQVAIRASGSSLHGSYAEETMIEEERSEKKTTKKTSDKKKAGSNPYGTEGPGPGGPGVLGAGPGARGEAIRTIPPEATAGIRPREANCRAVSAYAMVITATVPFDKQWQAFEEAFAHAPGGQNPKRDLPTYMAVWVKRADVTDNPNIDPAKITDWVQVSNSTPITSLPKNVKQDRLRDLEAVYGGIVRERCDETMLDGAILHPVPPFLLTDLREAIIHPAIPLQPIESADVALGPGGDIAAPPGADPTRPSNDGDFPDEPGNVGPDGRAGPGRLNSNASGTPSTAVTRPQLTGLAGADGRMPAVDYADGFDHANFKPPVKKMVRFVDFDVKPGRKYRYKVQLVLRDPNHPKLPSEAPDITTLDDKVRERIKKLEAAEAQTKRREYWLKTPESTPSEVVSFPNSEHFYAGEAVQPKEISLKELKVPGGEPSAKVMSVVWEPRIAAFVPAEKTVRRASYLVGKVDTEVVHPVIGDVRKLPGYPQTTEALVLDIAGGELLPGVDPRSPVRAPGATLIMNRSGKLVVTDEVHDVDGYHRYYFPEPKADAATNNIEAPGGMGEAMLDIPGYPPTTTKPGKNKGG
jgi:hypothetical protein